MPRLGWFKVLLIFSMTFIWSCSTFLQRRSCNKTDWYSHGYSIGQRGEHVERDPHVLKCLKVEAEVNRPELSRGHREGLDRYCNADHAYQVGSRGQRMDFGICEQELLSELKSRHRQGLEVFCAASNGYLVGSQGLRYDGVCMEFDEAAFLAEYRRGRKSYLHQEIYQSESRILAIDRTLISLETERTQLTNQMIALSARPNYTLTKERQYDAKTRTYKEVVKAEESDDQRRQRESLDSRISDLNSRVVRLRREQMNLRESIQKMRLEIKGLE